MQFSIPNSAMIWSTIEETYGEAYTFPSAIAMIYLTFGNITAVVAALWSLFAVFT